jgi:predicted nucleic acid-binding protein
MRKTNLYLDTSVISAIDTDSFRGKITREFFRVVTQAANDYELVVSPVTMKELLDASPEKCDRFTAFLENTPHRVLPANQDAENLAWLYVMENILTDNHISDLTHIAYAVVFRCDYVVSWNMRHIVHPKTISGVNNVNVLNNFNHIMIATPQLFTGEIDNANN